MGFFELLAASTFPPAYIVFAVLAPLLGCGVGVLATNVSAAIEARHE